MKATEPKRILYVGELSSGGTCLQRMNALRDLGHHVVPIDTDSQSRVHTVLLSRIAFKLFRMGMPWLGPFDLSGVNRRILNQCDSTHFDFLWLDKVLAISPATIRTFKSKLPAAKVIGYSPDDMGGRHNQSHRFLKSLKHYDCYATTKSHNIRELREVGCQDVYFVDKSYDPATHRPVKISDEERRAIGGRVGFIGSYEEERARSIHFLAAHGIEVKVYSEFWPREGPSHSNLHVIRKPMLGNDYAKAICSFDIALCFLRKLNRDKQTARSIEIPACGTLMLAERTNEHLRLFREGIEADFFSSDSELLAKVKRYCNDTAARNRIAANGRLKCVSAGYSHSMRLEQILEHVTRARR